MNMNMNMNMNINISMSMSMNVGMNMNETDNVKIGLVIMASGLGKRFGGNKLMEMLGDKQIIKWVLDATDGAFEKRIVVTRSADVKGLCDELNIDCILHELPGRNDTIRLGLSALMKDVDYCFFAQGDQPLISRECIFELANAAKSHKDKIVRTKYGDVVGAPVGFPKALFNDLLNLPEGKGGNLVVKNNQSLVRYVEVHNEYELRDIDTVEDLEELNKRK